MLSVVLEISFMSILHSIYFEIDLIAMKYFANVVKRYELVEMCTFYEFRVLVDFVDIGHEMPTRTQLAIWTLLHCLSPVWNHLSLLYHPERPSDKE